MCDKLCPKWVKRKSHTDASVTQVVVTCCMVQQMHSPGRLAGFNTCRRHMLTNIRSQNQTGHKSNWPGHLASATMHTRPTIAVVHATDGNITEQQQLGAHETQTLQYTWHKAQQKSPPPEKPTTPTSTTASGLQRLQLAQDIACHSCTTRTACHQLHVDEISHAQPAALWHGTTPTIWRVPSRTCKTPQQDARKQASTNCPTHTHKTQGTMQSQQALCLFPAQNGLSSTCYDAGSNRIMQCTRQTGHEQPPADAGQLCACAAHMRNTAAAGAQQNTHSMGPRNAYCRVGCVKAAFMQHSIEYKHT